MSADLTIADEHEVTSKPYSILALAAYFLKLGTFGFGGPVALIGYMQPIGDELETGAFLLIEYPIGCWFCEVPEPTGIVLVELPDGKSTTLTRKEIKIEGTLVLNGKDPEQFLFTIRDAKVGVVD